jgi:hypothetical protein
VKIKPVADIGDKWQRVAATRQTDYEQGVNDPTVDWARAAAAAKDSFEAGVNAAIQRGAFVAGVGKAGNDKWKRKTAAVGTQRWAPGVRAATDDYVAGFTPFRDVIERTQLPARAPRGDPRNAARSEAVQRALAEARMRK